MPPYAVALIILGVALIIFIICREMVCWYFKLNRIVGLLDKMYDVQLRSDETNHELLEILRRINRLTEQHNLPTEPAKIAQS